MTGTTTRDSRVVLRLPAPTAHTDLLLATLPTIAQIRTLQSPPMTRTTGR